MKRTKTQRVARKMMFPLVAFAMMTVMMAFAASRDSVPPVPAQAAAAPVMP